MARRKAKTREPVVEENVVKVEFGDNVQRNMGRYAEAVNLDRAIVDARDGLKPVQRRIIYTAYLDRLFPTAQHSKVAKLVGNVMGNYHPHGDSSIAQAIVNLSQEWKQRVPLIDIPGNNGDISGSPAAASRYIECRLNKLSMYLLDGYQKTVQMVNNYDNTKKEPVYLPGAVPNALINPAEGIGYGLATTILPHNPIELLNAAIALLDNPDISDDELLKIIPGPDFPTKGTLIGSKKQAMQELREGSGTFLVRGKLEVEKEGKETLLVATEVPFGTNTTKIIEQFGKVAKENPALNVNSVADETSNGNLRLVMRFKNDKFIEDAKELIWKYTDMETKLTSNNTMIVDNRPRQIGTREYLNYWLKFRKETLRKELEYDLKVNETKLNLVQGLIIVADDTDNIVKLAKESDGRPSFVKALLKYGLNQPQADNISGLALYRLNKQDHAKLLLGKKTLDEEIAKINNHLSHLTEYLRDNLEHAIKDVQEDDTVDTNRLTQLVDKVQRKKVNLNKLSVDITNKPVYIAVRTDATASRMTPRVYQNNIEDAKQERPIIKTLKAHTTDWSLFLTDSGRVVTRMVNDLQDINPKYDVESFYRQISDLKTDERFIDGEIFNEKIKKEQPYILSITEMGLAKLSLLEKSLPNTNTKRYLNHLTVYNGLKNEGDRVGFATVVLPEDIKNKKVIAIRDKDDKQLFEHDLDDLSIQNQGGSGARKVRTFNRDERDEVHFEIVDK